MNEFYQSCDDHLEAPGHDVPVDGDGRVVGRTEVDLVQLHHDLADDHVARVAVEAQDHKVQSQALKQA